MTDNRTIQQIEINLYNKVSNFLEEIKALEEDNDDLIELLTNIKENINNLSIKDLENAVSDSESNVNSYIESRLLPLNKNTALLEILLDNYSSDNKNILEDIFKDYKNLNIIYFDKEREINNPNNSFYTKRRIKELKVDLSRMIIKLSEETFETKMGLYSNDILFIRKEIAEKESFYNNQVKIENELRTENKKKDAYKKRVEKAIHTLNSDSSFLKKHIRYLKIIRAIFLISSTLCFICGFFFFYVHLDNLYYSYPYVLLTDWKIQNYFIISISIMFPSLFGLVFLKQLNIKSKEIYNISKRFVLMEEVIRSLNALIDVSEIKNLNIKVENTIDRLIDNILSHTIEDTNDINSNLSSNENKLLELNSKVDSLIDTFDKKISVINRVKGN
ncbi:hypothetical protein [Poseidonibacter lekithochrous]|uniref:hypothetical protein n=1 Tax=Poseidonibacter lekithochrous TaxID=1904463 RepID=UPI000D38C569|nr:hypothetical protein [Poseidonibacter lekithochrous]